MIRLILYYPNIPPTFFSNPLRLFHSFLSIYLIPYLFHRANTKFTYLNFRLFLELITFSVFIKLKSHFLHYSHLIYSKYYFKVPPLHLISPVKCSNRSTFTFQPLLLLIQYPPYLFLIIQ
jgi:hypothetical protein